MLEAGCRDPSQDLALRFFVPIRLLHSLGPCKAPAHSMFSETWLAGRWKVHPVLHFELHDQVLRAAQRTKIEEPVGPAQHAECVDISGLGP